MTDETRLILKKNGGASRDANESQKPVPHWILQMLANYAEGFTMTMVILSLTGVVLFPILSLFSPDLRAMFFNGRIFLIFKNLGMFSGLWALFFLWGVPARHASSKTRRSKWLDWLVRSK